MMALPHLLIGLRRRGWESLFFAVAALSAAGVAFSELEIMRSQTTEEIGRAHQWGHVPIFFMIAGIAGFVHFYFRTDRLWLGLAAVAIRFVSLIINFAIPPNLNFSKVTSVRRLAFLGDTVSMPQGIPNHFTRIAELSSILLIAYVVNASIRRWKMGTPENRRRAAIVGGR